MAPTKNASFIIQSTLFHSLLVGTRTIWCLIWNLNTLKTYCRPTNEVSGQRNWKTLCRRTTGISLPVLFRTNRRRRRDILMEYRGYVPLRYLGVVPLRHRRVFHFRLVWDLFETYVFLRRCYDFQIWFCGDELMRRLSNIFPKSCGMFHLRRTCDVAGTYRETSLRRLHNLLLPDGMPIIRSIPQGKWPKILAKGWRKEEVPKTLSKYQESKLW